LTATALAKKSPETAAVKATAAATLAKAEKVIAKKGPESKEAIAAINVATQAKAAVKTTKAAAVAVAKADKKAVIEEAPVKLSGTKAAKADQAVATADKKAVVEDAPVKLSGTKAAKASRKLS